MWLLLAVFAVASLVRLGLTERHSLWADEVFSLAIATGHSLEHPAATADPALGDFVEPEGPVYAEEFKRYLAHEEPPASPARVVRAVLLSDTNPPLYYLLLYGWTLVIGTSDAALRLFSTAWSLACLPLPCRYRSAHGRVGPSCPVAFSSRSHRWRFTTRRKGACTRSCGSGCLPRLGFRLSGANAEATSFFARHGLGPRRLDF